MKQEVTLSMFTDQVNNLVTENRHLTLKTESQENTIGMLSQQYDDLASSVEAMRAEYEQNLHTLRVERDQAVRKFTKINALLMQCADLTMQAIRAKIGDETPEKMPETLGNITDHPALPPNKIEEMDDEIRDVVRRLPRAQA